MEETKHPTFWEITKEDWKWGWKTRHFENDPFTREWPEHDELQLATMFLYYFTKHLIDRTICHFFDHNLVDDSCFGPDSGTETVFCSRCGWSWSHTYY